MSKGPSLGAKVQEPREERRTPEQRAADVSSAEPSLFCRQDAGSTLRFMESFNLQNWTRIGALNRHIVAQPSRLRVPGRLAAWAFVERDARRTRRRDARATGQAHGEGGRQARRGDSILDFHCGAVLGGGQGPRQGRDETAFHHQLAVFDFVLVFKKPARRRTGGV